MGFGVVATTTIVCVSLLWIGAACRLSAGVWREWRKLDVIDETLRQLSAGAVARREPPVIPVGADFLFAFPHRQAARRRTGAL
jgi:hypothetical protein